MNFECKIQAAARGDVTARCVKWCGVSGTCPANELHPNQRAERVNHPAHYGGEGNPYETIKVLEAWLTPEEFIGFLKGTIIKYQSRAGKHVAQESAQQDYGKANWYSNYLTQYLERRK